MSYVHLNDDYDNGYISRFRERLEGAVRVHQGEDFNLFQDRTHIHVGHKFEDRTNEFLAKATILIPIITPHYFNSEWCRKEFEYFWSKEQITGRGPLIYPVYYIDSKQMANARQYPPDSMEWRLSRYQYADWRKLRFVGLLSAPVRRRFALLASEISDMFAQLEATASPSHTLISPDSSESFARVPPSESNEHLGPPQDILMLPRADSFHGRSSDLARVIDNLTPTRGRRIVCIVGPEGIGKSVLASEAIRLLKMDDWFRDGIAVVLCNQISDPMAILRKVLSRFDSRRRPPVQTTEEGLIAEAHRLLDQKDAAIVVDDVTVRRDTARAIEALHSTGVAILLTSKKSTSLAHAVRIRLSQLRQKDALSLLTEGLARRSSNGAAKP
jgi:hypothetical protein